MTIYKCPDQTTRDGVLKLTVFRDGPYYIEGMMNTELYHQERLSLVYEHLVVESNALHITVS